MQVQLDLDLEKLIEFTFQIQNKDTKGIQASNRGGWQSNDIQEKKHEEFIKLKKEINQYLQTYHSEVFGGIEFEEEQNLDMMWTNINGKYHYNEWHIHLFSTISGVYYIKHDGSVENGNLMFKHPNNLYMGAAHWPSVMPKTLNEVTSEIVNIVPKSNMLLLFPSWLEHKVEDNLKNDLRISLSFNATLTSEKKS